MGRIYFAVALAAVFSGSWVSTGNSQTGAPSQSSIPAAIAKDCQAHILKEFPKAKFVGGFARLVPPTSFARKLTEGKVLWIAAPTRAPGFMDRIVKHSLGCKYSLVDGKAIFDSLIPEMQIPRRALLPGEE